MRILASLRSAVWTLLHRSRIESEMDEELRVHMQDRARDLECSGVPPAEAERQARLEFGGYQKFREQCREAVGTHFVATLIQDVRYGLRIIRKSPGFTTVAVLTLALGIGANVVAFSWLQTIVLNSVQGIANPSSVLAIVQSDPNGVLVPFVSYPDFTDLAGANDAFAGLVGTRTAPAVLQIKDRSQWVSATVASANLFQVLGVSPELGRGFLPSEDAREGGAPVAVISDGLWRREFGGDAAVIGRSIVLNQHQFTIVGIAPPGFPGIEGSHTDLWAPLAMHDAVLYFGSFGSRTFRWVRVVARLRDGVSAERAQAELALLAARLARTYSDSDAGIQFKAFPLWKSPFGSGAAFLPVLRIVLAMNAGILLIVTANLSGLLLSRVMLRQPEVALRTALGAGRLRLVRQFLTENLLLGLVGGAVGLLFAMWAARLLSAVVAQAFPFHFSLTVNAATIGFAVALTVVTAILYGIAPAFVFTRSNLVAPSKAAAASSGSTRKLLNVFVVVEVALSLVLLIGAGLCVRGFRQAKRLDLGFDPHGVLYASLDLVPNGYSAARGKIFDRTLRQRLLTHPGIMDAAFVNTPPLGGGGAFVGQIDLQGHQSQESATRNMPFVIVSPGYFSLMRIPLMEGRDFDDADEFAPSNLALVNGVMAERYWPGLDPIGRRFRMAVGIAPTDTFTVIGVVRAARYGSLAEPPAPMVYVNYLQRPLASLFMNVLVRTAADPRNFSSLLRSDIHDLDPAVEPLDLMPLQDYIGPSFLPVRTAAALLVVLSAAALLLAGIGLYGVMSYAVSRRTREIGIRLALGALPGNTLRMVARQGMVLVVAGIAAGQVVSFGVTRLLARFLYGISPVDPATLAGSALLLCVVALAACIIPARRAMRVDPITALRYVP